MKSMDSLIRLRKWELDEKRRKVSELERLAQRLHDQLAGLDAELVTEQRIAAADPLAAGSYGGYANAVIERRERLLRSLKDVEVEMGRALDEVAEAFQEFKKLDTIRDRERERQEWRARRLQQVELDAAGLDVFRRNQRPAGG